MDILDDMGVSKFSAKVFFFKVNYSFKMFRSYLTTTLPKKEDFFLKSNF